MKKHLIWAKTENGGRRTAEYNDDLLFAILLFLNEGIGFETYRKFLLDENQIEKGGNISYWIKSGNMVTVEVFDIFPEDVFFTTSIKKMLKIMDDFESAERLDPEKIILERENNEILVKTSD